MGPVQGLYGLKAWYTRRLTVFVRWAERGDISPDVFTLVGIVGAALAALCLWRGWWPLVLVFLAVRLGGANLDGAVARARGVSRPWGFVLNEIGDRASDLLMFAGLWALAQRQGGVSVLVPVAAVAASLPTFVSLSAAGAGATRRNGGPFGKTERCLVAVLACALPQWLAGWMIVMIAGSLLTAVVRAVGAHRELRGAPR